MDFIYFKSFSGIMAYTPESTSVSSPLGKWVEDFYARVMGQPNDELSTNDLYELTTQDFTASSIDHGLRINHDKFSRDEFSDALNKFRVLNVTKIQSTKEIQTWEAPEGTGAGCVSQFVTVHDINKETGLVTKATTLLVANIKVVDGKKRLVELTEVFNSNVAH
ncbi:hypothetical protein HJFPF1_07432 [Paramyrothecium foliicola]|nr:hypothetical protein HJFPF1_07432 [Paramyrothecium foliicola]